MVVKKTYTPAELIIEKQNTESAIKDAWTIITTFNVVEKSFVQRENVKELYEEVKTLEADLINFKLAIQAINMGETSLANVNGKSAAYPSIYALSLLKERLKKLDGLLVNINKESTSESKIELSSSFIKSEQSELKTEILIVNEELTKFNESIKFKL